MVLKYFFDSYALFELIKGNENYKKYSKDIIIVTTKLNLMELHYGLLAEFDKRIADKYYDKFVKYTIEINDFVFKKSNELRLKYRKRKLSYVDCIGYTLALLNNIKFLTGDKQFEDLLNVEYVK